MFPTLALSKSGYGSKRNYASSQPVFTSSPYVIFGMPKNDMYCMGRSDLLVIIDLKKRKSKTKM